jgi:hypothetical protein
MIRLFVMDDVLYLESFVLTMAAAIPANSDLLRTNEDNFLSKLLFLMRQWRYYYSINPSISAWSLQKFW